MTDLVKHVSITNETCSSSTANICAVIPHPGCRAAACESQHPTICRNLLANLLHVFHNISLCCTKPPTNTPQSRRLLPVQDSAVISSRSTPVFHTFLVDCTLVRYARRPRTSQLTPKWTDCSGPGPVNRGTHADRPYLPRMNDESTCACRTFTWTMTSGNHTSMFCVLCCEWLAS